jgi:hypothetical protein
MIAAMIAAFSPYLQNMHIRQNFHLVATEKVFVQEKEFLDIIASLQMWFIDFLTCIQLEIFSALSCPV